MKEEASIGLFLNYGVLEDLGLLVLQAAQHPVRRGGLPLRQGQRLLRLGGLRGPALLEKETLNPAHQNPKPET